MAPAIPHQVAPGTFEDDALMGSQLTEQYQRAIGGAVEVLKFGAMMLMLREKLSARGQLQAGRPSKDADPGVSAWLKEHAPEVKRPTAYRFLHVAEAIEAAFPLPAKVSFIKLATTPTEALPPKLRTKQQELWDFVSGTSQRSWLDQFKPIQAGGGLRTKTTPELTPEERYKAALAQIRKDHLETFSVLESLTNRNAFQALPEPELHLAIDTAEKFLAQARAWVSTPKSKRTLALTID